MTFSLIIPTYNEAPFIVPTLRALIETFARELKSDWEIIVSDNASTDNTAGIALSLGDARVRVIHSKEQGKGQAIRAGSSNAKGVIVGFTDADLSISPEEIARAFLRVQACPSTVLIGSRYHPKSSMPGREWWRIGSSLIFNILARTIVGTKMIDTQCPLKVLDKAMLPILFATKENTWFFDLELVALLEHLHIPIEEVPVTWNEHRYPKRRSKLSTIRDGLRAIPALFRIRRQLPTQLMVLQAMKR